MKRKSQPQDKLEGPKPFAGKVVLPPGRRGVSVHIAGRTLRELQEPLPYTGDPRSIEEIEASNQRLERQVRIAGLIVIVLAAIVLVLAGMLVAILWPLATLPH